MTANWWKGAVIYHIYPRSFFDSNGDGIGDLAGITEKLDYVADLGVDGIWLSPFFASPMRDFGYDVSDYLDVDPIFGDLADFDRLLARAHALELKVIIDQVYSHTSDRHPWFLESRSSKSAARADWYVWADPKPDGSPPNNWLSFFGGPAWSWDTQRKQYYLHNFLAEQPDLNFHNPDVQDAILDVARFWFNRGVDGLRLDVANFYFHDAELRDNPPSGLKGQVRPYLYQQHLYDRSRPDNLDFLARLRTVINDYESRMTVAEINSASNIERSIEYTQGASRLHTAYNFMFLDNHHLSADLIRCAISSWLKDDTWPSWSFSNHDVKRVLTRWGGRDAPQAFAKLLNALLVSLRGTMFLYQGEELGLPQADVPYERLQDPEAIRFWPDNLGRDGCRTPMPWQARRPQGGFSWAEPWLPVDPRHEALAVDIQEPDVLSTLSFTRSFLAFRKKHAALIHGDIILQETPEPVVAFERRHQGQALLCAFNLGGDTACLDAPDDRPWTALKDCPLTGSVKNGRITLPPYAGLIATLS